MPSVRQLTHTAIADFIHPSIKIGSFDSLGSPPLNIYVVYDIRAPDISVEKKAQHLTRKMQTSSIALQKPDKGA